MHVLSVRGPKEGVYHHPEDSAPSSPVPEVLCGSVAAHTQYRPVWVCRGQAEANDSQRDTALWSSGYHQENNVNLALPTR